MIPMISFLVFFSLISFFDGSCNLFSLLLMDNRILKCILKDFDRTRRDQPV